MAPASSRRPQVPASRNDWLALGAAVSVLAQLPRVAGGVLRLLDTIEYTDANRLVIAAALGIAAPVIAAAGWALAAVMLRSGEFRWRRMAWPAALLAGSAAAAAVGAILELLVTNVSLALSEHRLMYWLGAASASGILVAFAVAWAACLAPDGGARRRRFGIAALVLGATYAIAAAAGLAQESFYAAYAVPQELLSGLQVSVGGAVIFTIAAAVAGLAFLVAGAHRETALSAAAAVAALGFGIVAIGEALVAASIGQISREGHSGTVDWLILADRVAVVVALLCVAIGTRIAAQAAATRAPGPFAVKPG